MSFEIDIENSSDTNVYRYWVDPSLFFRGKGVPNTRSYVPMNEYTNWLYMLLYRAILKQKTACGKSIDDRIIKHWKFQRHIVPVELHNEGMKLVKYYKKSQGPGAVIDVELANALYEFKKYGFTSYNEHYDYLKKELIELEKMTV